MTSFYPIFHFARLYFKGCKRTPAAFKDTVAIISEGLPAGKNEYIELLFGSLRLTYRVGCWLIERIERDCGYAAVQDGVNLTGDEFLGLYGRLLDDTLQPSQ